MAKRPASKPRDEAFLTYLYSFRKGEVGDRQRWLAWAAMVTLMAKASPRERRRWERLFHTLSQVEHNAALTDAEQGQAFMDLLAPLWPTRSRRGRRRIDNSGFFSEFPKVHARFASAWGNGAAGRGAAVDQVAREIQAVDQEQARVEFHLGDQRPEILRTKSPRRAALLIFAHAYGEDVDSLDQALRRSGVLRQNS